MTELAAALGANDEFLHLDEPLPSGIYFRIDDELVAVTGRTVRATRTTADGTIVSVREGPEPDGTIISVKRGLYGTTPAAHDSGTELTARVDAYTTDNPFNVGGEGGAIAVTGGGVTVPDVTEIDLGAVPVTDAGGGVAAVEQTVLARTVTLTDAQIKALPSTPIVIIPAPGAGKVILPVMATVIFDRTDDGDYTNIPAGATIQFLLGGAVPLSDVAEVSGDVSDLLAAGSDSMVTTIPYQRATTDYTRGASGDPPQVNQPLSLSAASSGGDFTGGHVDNEMKVTVFYVVIEFA